MVDPSGVDDVAEALGACEQGMHFPYSQVAVAIGDRYTDRSVVAERERLRAALREGSRFPFGGSVEKYNSIAAKGTCRWIYHTKEFRNWIRQRQSVLCVTGSFGSGKSCLLASLAMNPWGLRSEVNLPPQPLIIRLFYDSLQIPDLSQILQALLVQAIPEEGLTHWVHTTSAGQLDMSIEDLQDALLQSLINLGQEKSIFMFLDDLTALELDVSGGLVSFLGRLVDHACSTDIALHVCYSKRDYPIVEAAASTFPTQFQVRIDAFNQQDIQSWVRYSLESTFRQGVVESNDSIERAVSKILEEAGTSFAAASIYLRHLEENKNNVPFQKLDECLEVLPRPLEEMWLKLLRDLLTSRNPHGARAMDMMQCVLTAQRLLSPQDLYCVCNMPCDMTDSDVRSALVADSLGLLTLLPDTTNAIEPGKPRVIVSFVQPALKVFLASPAAGALFTETLHLTHADFVAGDHGRFVQAGIKCLKEFLPDYRDQWKDSLPPFVGGRLFQEPKPRSAQVSFDQIFKGYPLLEYTVRYLFKHAREAQHSDDLQNLEETSQDGCTLLAVWGHLQNCLQRIETYGPSVTLQHVLARYNMSEYLKRYQSLEVKTESAQTILHWAAFYGSEEVVGLVINRTVETQLEVLLQSSRKKHLTGTRCLYFACRESEDGMSALDIAVQKGHVNIVNLLLSFRDRLVLRLDKDHEDNKGWRLRQPGIFPLDYASWMRRELYAAWETHLNDNTQGRIPALHRAVKKRLPVIVKKLLGHGADWRVQSESLTPLQMALRLAEDENPLHPATKTIVRVLKVEAFAVLDNATCLDSEMEPVDRLYEATVNHIDGRDLLRSEVTIPELLKENGVDQTRSPFTWIHLPANNILILQLLGQQKRDKMLRHELWTSRQIRGSERSHISFMRPGCEKIDETDDFVIIMPYLHWETQRKQRRLEAFSLCKFLLESEADRIPSLVTQLSAENNDILNTFAEIPSSDPKIAALGQELRQFLTTVESSKANKVPAQERLQKALQAYREEACASDRDMRLFDSYTSRQNVKHPLHIRRTLDQSFYYTLDNTSTRNKDQVVARYGRKEGRKEPIVIMVDQLWLWCSGNTLITCFPQRRECNPDDPDRFDMTDILENILHPISPDVKKKEGGKGPLWLIPGIVKECAGAFFDPMKNVDDGFRFLDMFSNSISRIADGEVACYQRFVKMLRVSSQQNLMDIDTESDLLREIKDILDELRMIRVVMEDQLKVIAAIRAPFLCAQKSQDPRVWDDVRESVERYLDKVRSMQNEGQATVNSLNALMDLRQRHATLWEAKSTGMQGNTITVFTVVTILFLPASFMASFFALPIMQFSKAESSDSLDLSYVVKWLMAFTVPVALFFISIAFYINDILNFLSRISGHERRVARFSAEAWKQQIGQGIIAPEPDNRQLRDGSETGNEGNEDVVSQHSQDEPKAQSATRRRKLFRFQNRNTDSPA
ncbi:uncharacterized protein BO95DRAFT_493259 [Aspergillus brunneoviolaceus CBS 621.78]|uniref:Uncharacterized protein n=1 Tax=Aspergillus brunneoviolaceus CBS 621.78 TaxID=1450534 RepID=A0ACD1GDN6_9EURO|nr:hypothetical protein BO95DRAFT_493259 [Aspergillus brunneoviolaceus CBS 621.78]RAH47399.1 hypothetical protein BO95DRAFT_493259 [Aspergillus brunneoviolaceus CBS 621.78]